MAKLKIKKNDVWIDMTPMSDVMVLLLTFFMLSANFVESEAVKVQTPKSTNVDKIPEKAKLNIMIAPQVVKAKNGTDSIVGKVYLGTDNVSARDSSLNKIMLVDPLFKESVGKKMNDDLKKTFLAETQIGIPMKLLPEYLGKPSSERSEILKNYGVPLDSIDGGPSEFQMWVQALKKGYAMWYKDLELRKEKGEKGIDLSLIPKKLDICIKADKNTPYVTFKKVISELQDIMESRYKLVTEFKKEED